MKFQILRYITLEDEYTYVGIMYNGYKNCQEIVLMEIELSLDLIEYDLENHSKYKKLIEEDHTSKRKLLDIKERCV